MRGRRAASVVLGRPAAYAASARLLPATHHPPPKQDFRWLLEAVALAARCALDHCAAVGEAVGTIMAAAKAPKQQLAAAAADARDACAAVAEAAVGRWSKLLGARARGGGAGGAGGGASGQARWVGAARHGLLPGLPVH